MTQTDPTWLDGLDANARFVVDHFDDFVNKRRLDAIDHNMADNFVDHDGPGGKMADRTADRAMMAKMHELFPDLRVEVRDCVSQDDMVVVRNVWTATDAKTNQRMEFHGFVQWRIEAGKIAERWATVTPMHELAADALDW